MSRGQLKEKDLLSIQENYTFIKEEIDARDLVDFLYEQGVINNDDKERITRNSTNLERNEEFLQTVQRAGPGDAYGLFLISLEDKYPHVADRLRKCTSNNEIFNSNSMYIGDNKQNNPVDDVEIQKAVIENYEENNKTILIKSTSLHELLESIIDQETTSTFQIQSNNENIVSDVNKNNVINISTKKKSSDNKISDNEQTIQCCIVKCNIL